MVDLLYAVLHGGYMILIKSKNLDYWKKKLLAVLKGDVLEKSLSDILYPGIMLKSYAPFESFIVYPL